MPEQKPQTTMQSTKKAVEGANAFLSQNVAPVLDDLVSRTQDGTAAGLWARRAALHLTVIQQSLELLGQDVDALSGILAPPKKVAIVPEMREEVRRAPPAVRRVLEIPKVAGLRATLDEQSAKPIVEDDGVTAFEEQGDFPEDDEPEASTDALPEQEGGEPDVEAMRDLMKRQVAQNAVIAATTRRITTARAKLASMKPHAPGRGKLSSELEGLTQELAAAQEEKDRLDAEAQLLVQ